VLVWAAVYVVLVVIAVIIVLARREPTVVRGDWVFLLTSLYILLAAAVTAWRGERFSLGVLAVTGAVLILGWMVQARWWIVGAKSDVVVTHIEQCASRLCAPATRASNECTISVPGGAMRLRLSPAGGSTMIVFVSSAKHKKVELFRKLLAKQSRPVLPTIRIGPSAGDG
jgi:hypothetical protein